MIAPLQAAGGRVYSNEEDFANHYPAMRDWGHPVGVLRFAGIAGVQKALHS